MPVYVVLRQYATDVDVFYGVYRTREDAEEAANDIYDGYVWEATLE